MDQKHMGHKSIARQNTLGTELADFIEWHFTLKAETCALKLRQKDEDVYLSEVYPQKRDSYNQQVKRLGELTQHFHQEQKKNLFYQIKDIGLHDLLRGSPYFYQAIFKPRGYAGDAEMMDIIYRDRFEGVNSFSKILHKIGTDCGACIAIRNRKNLLKEAFKDYQMGKVLSLAAGPAQEIYEFTEETKPQTDFLALDHDIDTLKNAYSKNSKLSYGIINAFHLIKGKRRFLIPRRAHIDSCLPKTDTKGFWNQLALPVKYTMGHLKENSFDLIYSAGLFDYIRTFPDPKKGTKALTHILFDLLKPGGRLLIGNVSPAMPIGERWVMECKCDWYLIYRNREEVLEFAESIPPNQLAQLEVITEESGVNWFLDIRKK